MTLQKAAIGFRAIETMGSPLIKRPKPMSSEHSDLEIQLQSLTPRSFWHKFQCK